MDESTKDSDDNPDPAKLFGNGAVTHSGATPSLVNDYKPDKYEDDPETSGDDGPWKTVRSKRKRKLDDADDDIDGGMIMQNALYLLLFMIFLPNCRRCCEERPS